LQEEKRADERTRTADLISSYEFAYTRSSLSYCVRKQRLFRRFSIIRGCHLSSMYQCVSSRLQYAYVPLTVLGRICWHRSRTVRG